MDANELARSLTTATAQSPELVSSPPTESAAPVAEAPPPGTPAAPPAIPSTPVESAAPPAAAPVEAPPAEVPPPSTALLDQAKSYYGASLDLSKYTTDEDFLKGVRESQKLIGQHNDLTALGKAVAANPAAFIAEYAPKFGFAPPGAPAPAPLQAPVAPSRPEWHDEWLQAVEVDPASGRAISVKPGFDPALVNKVNTGLDYLRTRQRELLMEPEKALADILAKQRADVLAEVRGDFERQQAEQSRAAEAMGFVQQNRHWLFDQTGQTLSPLGSTFYEGLREAAQFGIDPNNTRAMTAYAMRGMPQAAPNGQPTNGAKTPHAAAPTAAAAKPNTAPNIPVRPAGRVGQGETLKEALAANLDQGGF